MIAAREEETLYFFGQGRGDKEKGGEEMRTRIPELTSKTECGVREENRKETVRKGKSEQGERGVSERPGQSFWIRTSSGEGNSCKWKGR